ncbi:SMK killer toxin resistance protein [Yamadazyma tenuis]|uniref:SMK killer toxin resistance protein n=1 Tax=Candida tenuis (strain ATCC 10573 / BCRC 21748 / CBS 615 / JCM 9827 / NBRC 10315 / NRRL Y-1498 / VKM Y-70) TaxID=590646 RepID=G3BEV9_CANTC|nr:SMK killer toxin resistance protein [Yamadazyma tenuis ATCC 10573]XP_006689821.1 uncharacterized protein CANTEDRAFT_116681 [Yamadazyma tenuis ATCC 10573]EGV60606.1 SMK killer toxin resistance protein [Yamadazyma tenuis ATCC 10573]EGV60607.1 hypothetical protein CANTEDRAFT_116681 [Yamadazyma tenuis ATCC 10573]WEJ94145.1 SMK killer toxin resistance protein [Yamadazyma tenuis]
MSFITELWESVFTPGTTPALIKATHGSFIMLILSLCSLVFMTRSIHFVNLLVISILLYASVVWFIHELNQAKLKDNLELEKEVEEDTTSSEKEVSKVEDAKSSEKSSTSATAKPSASPKKRKV